jgi:hypothetical protein
VHFVFHALANRNLPILLDPGKGTLGAALLFGASVDRVPVMHRGYSTPTVIERKEIDDA